MKFDFKITTWERVEVPTEHEEKVLEAIKNGTITSSQDVFDLLEDDTDMIDCNVILETEEQMSVEDNGGNSTIEVLDGTETVWKNSLQ